MIADRGERKIVQGGKQLDAVNREMEVVRQFSNEVRRGGEKVWEDSV